MIETKTQINGRIKLCKERFYDKEYPFDMKSWETSVIYTLKAKLKEKDYKGE
jgi:hypothetical protein